MEIRQRTLATAVVLAALLASPGLLVSSPIGAAATPIVKAACPARMGAPDRQFLFFNVCGPRDVTRNRSYDYIVVLTNGGHADTGKVKLALSHYDPITRSSIPYRQVPGRVRLRMYEAVWALANLQPGHSFRVTITLSFRQHGKNSLFIVKAVGQHPGAVGGMKKDVFFK
jgi:hypothetical protein